MPGLPTPRPVAAVVFDMDGTLIDSESIYRAALVRALDEIGLAADEAFVHGLNGLPGPAVNARILARFGADFPAETFRRHYVTHRDALAAGGIPLKPGAAEALRFVAGRRLKLALATSSQLATAQAHLGRLELLAHFDVLVTSEDVARAKPFPDVFLTAAARLGVAAADCLAVEDSPTGVQAALAAGMMTVMVPDVAAPTAGMRARCVAVQASLLELPGLFPA
jgi:HAD superfamily hydrolase (TIGR01509 family)